MLQITPLTDTGGPDMKLSLALDENCLPLCIESQSARHDNYQQGDDSGRTNFDGGCRRLLWPFSCFHKISADMERCHHHRCAALPAILLSSGIAAKVRSHRRSLCCRSWTHEFINVPASIIPSGLRHRLPHLH